MSLIYEPASEPLHIHVRQSVLAEAFAAVAVLHVRQSVLAEAFDAGRLYHAAKRGGSAFAVLNTKRVTKNTKICTGNMLDGFVSMRHGEQVMVWHVSSSSSLLLSSLELSDTQSL